MKNTSVVYMTAIKPTTALDCVDLPMEDEGGNDCSYYKDNDYCTSHGYPTPAGCQVFANSTANDCRMPRGFDLSGGGRRNLGTDAAALQCCHCGGGNIVPPDNWGTASQIEVVM